ncbi:MAG: hypothetical protein OXU61_08010, partial [Gammaproteobacteria bacterium]|nr:hypothetical protein [Gammaproteobacteria bacterium]
AQYGEPARQPRPQAVTQSRASKAARSYLPWISAFVRITPPLRGSRQDEGASPMSRRWGGHLERPLRRRGQGNRKGRIGSPSRRE